MVHHWGPLELLNQLFTSACSECKKSLVQIHHVVFQGGQYCKLFPASDSAGGSNDQYQGNHLNPLPVCNCVILGTVS